MERPTQRTGKVTKIVRKGIERLPGGCGANAKGISSYRGLGHDYIEALPNKVSLTVPANGSRMGEGAIGTIVLAIAARK
jgi:hypothetical protein